MMRAASRGSVINSGSISAHIDLLPPTRRTAVVDRLERLVNLTATLLRPAVRLTLDEPPNASNRATRGSTAHAGGSSSATRRPCASWCSHPGGDRDGSAPSRRTGSTPTTLPAGALADRARARGVHVAVTAVRLEGDAGREGWQSSGASRGEGADSPFAELDVTPVSR